MSKAFKDTSTTGLAFSLRGSFRRAMEGLTNRYPFLPIGGAVFAVASLLSFMALPSLARGSLSQPELLGASVVFGLAAAGLARAMLADEASLEKARGPGKPLVRLNRRPGA